MPVTFGGVYLIRGNSLNEGYDPQVERALRRIRAEAQKQNVPVADIRMQRAGIPSVEHEGALSYEIRAVLTAEDAVAAQPLIEQVNGRVKTFRSGQMAGEALKEYMGWWRELKAIVGDRGTTGVNSVNRQLTRKQLDVVEGPRVEFIPLLATNPGLAKERVRASSHNDPPAQEPNALVRAFSWLKERLF